MDITEKEKIWQEIAPAIEEFTKKVNEFQQKHNNSVPVVISLIDGKSDDITTFLFSDVQIQIMP